MYLWAIILCVTKEAVPIMSVPAFSSPSNNFPVQTHRQKWFSNLLLFLCRLDDDNNNEGIRVSLSYTKWAIIDLLRRFVWRRETTTLIILEKNPGIIISSIFSFTIHKVKGTYQKHQVKPKEPLLAWAGKLSCQWLSWSRTQIRSPQFAILQTTLSLQQFQLFLIFPSTYTIPTYTTNHFI